jgi:flagellar hook-associated protein 2
MAQISSSTGLVSGLDYKSIIDQLMTIEKKPVENLTTQLSSSKSVQAAYTTLSASMLSLSLTVNQFGQSSVLNARQATSSNSAVLQATAATTAIPGTYSFRPLQQAQAQGYTSTGFATATSTVGAGTISIKRGGFVTSDTVLESLNGGAGVASGKIRLIDRGGSSTIVDLTGARTINDVVAAINDNGGAAITASISGDSLVLTDRSGSTTGNLVVQEVGTGRTAADLGLLGSVAANTKTGTDLVKLGSGLKLSFLNDGLGVRTQGTLDDLRITAKDGTQVDVKLSSAKTIGDVVAAINSDSQNGGKVVASIDAGGDKLVLTDATGGGGTLSVANLNGSRAAQDLGLLGSEQGGGVLTGKRVVAALNSVLLQNVRGGQGIATPGQIQLTDRSGATATVDLTNAASLSDVVDAINGAGLGITASINAQNHGLTLTDTTGATTSNLIVADVGGGTTAANLHLTANAAVTTVQSGDLHRRYLDEATSLSSLNGGDGISAGSFKITDKAGGTAIINLTGSSFRTLDDLITSINGSGVAVTASINTTGDGLLLTDTSGGNGSLGVEDLNGGKAAADLRIKGSTTTTKIDGAYTYSVDVSATDTLNDVMSKLKQSGAPVSVSTYNTGGVDPIKVLVNSSKSGSAGAVLIDSGATGLNLNATQTARDAVVQLVSNGAAPVLFTSSTNTFTSTVQGVSLTLTGTSASPVSVTVTDDSSKLSTAITQFVTGFNSVTSTLKDQLSFDSATEKRGLLQGDGTAVQLQSTLFDLVGRRYGTGGAISNFSQLGITVAGGKISFDPAKLQAAITADPDAVRNFFSTATSGAAAYMKTALDGYTNSGTGRLFNRIDTLENQGSSLQSRIDSLNSLLDIKQQKLENQFAMLENTLSKLKDQQSSLTTLTQLAAAASSSTG